MKSLLLISILVATIVTPIAFSRVEDARAGLRRIVYFMAGFFVFYLLALRYIYPRLG